MNLNAAFGWRSFLSLALRICVPPAIFRQREESPLHHRLSLPFLLAHLTCVTLFLSGCSQRELPLYAKAQAAFNTTVTNSLGWRRTLETSVNVYDDDWKKWQGRAEIEVTNAAGGVQTTNLPFRFTVTQSEGKTNVSCYLDIEQIIAVRRVLDEFIPGETPQQFNERLQRARSGAK
ncbi:MAG: hypothetical protein U1F83_04570 [Verrucomicrobiota bacterium]